MIKFRNIMSEDRMAIKAILEATKHFSESDIGIAMELVDSVIKKHDLTYRFVVAENGGQVVGYGCWGEIPLTAGAYDIYWIAVDPEIQGEGVGSRMLAFMEDEIMKSQGRVILIETSSSEDYQGTRHFYEKCGYQLESRIQDYYKPGDDRCIYVKRFEPFY